MSGILSVFAFGRVGTDPQVLSTGTGTPMLVFKVACNTGWGDNKKTTWLDCAMFGKRAESVAQYVKKGQEIAISGNLTAEPWESNGKNGMNLKVMVQELSLTSTGPQQNSSPNDRGGSYANPAPQGGQTSPRNSTPAPWNNPQQAQTASVRQNPGDFDDDIPF